MQSDMCRVTPAPSNGSDAPPPAPQSPSFVAWAGDAVFSGLVDETVGREARTDEDSRGVSSQSPSPISVILTREKTIDDNRGEPERIGASPCEPPTAEGREGYAKKKISFKLNDTIDTKMMLRAAQAAAETRRLKEEVMASSGADQDAKVAPISLSDPEGQISEIPSYCNWASCTVYSGLIPRQQHQQQKQPSQTFNSWAVDAVFCNLPSMRDRHTVPAAKEQKEQHNVMNRSDRCPSVIPLGGVIKSRADDVEKKESTKHYNAVGGKSIFSAAIKTSLAQRRGADTKDGYVTAKKPSDPSDCDGKAKVNASQQLRATLYNDWAKNVVFSGLVPKRQKVVQQKPFISWAEDTLYRNLPSLSTVDGEADATEAAAVKLSARGPQKDSGANNTAEASTHNVVSGKSLFGAAIKSSLARAADTSNEAGGAKQTPTDCVKVDSPEEDGSCSSSSTVATTQSENPVNIGHVLGEEGVRNTTNTLGMSGESSMDSTPPLAPSSDMPRRRPGLARAESSPRVVSFRGRDSYITNTSLKGLKDSSSMEASVDMETLLEMKTGNGGLPSVLETPNDRLGKSVGDIGFNLDKIKSSFPQRSLSEPSNSHKMDMMGKSQGGSDFNYDDSLSTLPPQRDASQPPEVKERADIPANGDNDGIPNPDLQQMDESPTYPQTNGAASDAERDVSSVLLRLPSKRMRDLIRKSKDEHAKTTNGGAIAPVTDGINHDDKKPRPNEQNEDGSLARNDTTATQPPLRAEHRQSENGGLNSTKSQPSEKSNEEESTHDKVVITPLQKQASEVVAKQGKVTQSSRYRIPTLIRVTVTKRKVRDKIGMVCLDDRDHRVIVSKMTPNSPLRNTQLALKDELLIINGHRVKCAEKAAAFVKVAHGRLNLTAFSGKRPKESEVLMMRLDSNADGNDIQFLTSKGIVHVLRADGRFANTGKIMCGDILLSVNGVTVTSARKALKLLWEGVKEDTRPTDDYVVNSSSQKKQNSQALAVLLIFSLANLRHRLAMKMSSRLPLLWNEEYNECALEQESGEPHHVLHIHDGGYVDFVPDSLEELDPDTRRELEMFAETFHAKYQQSMTELRDAIQLQS